MKMLLVSLGVIVVLIFLAYFILKLPTFGSIPQGASLERILKSPQYSQGAFQNSSYTPMMAEGVSYWNMLGWYTWNRPITAPPKDLPFVKRDLKILPSSTKPVITWFGHASYLLQIEGLNILMDPVFSGIASPFSFIGSKSYGGTNEYKLADLPPIDFVLLSHDHYDHLDYESILFLKNSVKKFITPLGVGAHLEHWGIPPSNIIEMDWWETNSIVQKISIDCTPARHFSGRGLLDRGKTLWASYVLQAGNYRLYLGGDSGYDTHFKKIGEKFGPFDLAILECGQYHPYWRYIHMLPPEVVVASQDLKAKMLLPVHWGKFTLALHPWNEPITLLSAEAKKYDLPLITPKIGEAVILDSIYPSKVWWNF